LKDLLLWRTVIMGAIFATVALIGIATFLREKR
jgi:hypothetical protein